MVWLIPIAMVCMAISNVLDACMTIAESKGKAMLAGGMAAGDNVFGIAVGIIGADTLIQHGLNQTLVMAVAVFVVTWISTSLATAWATKEATKFDKDPESPPARMTHDPRVNAALLAGRDSDSPSGSKL